MKCFCKLPGKHHHELWYTLSGFHIVRLPLDSQLGLYILSWKQFWISYFLFSSDFPYASLHFFFLLIILVWMHLLLLFDASLFFFLLFVHVCVLLILLWLATLCACLMQSPPLQVNKCMCTLVGHHQIQILTRAKLPPHLKQRLKKIPKKNLKKEKISNPKQIQSPKGKKLLVYWLVFCNVCDCRLPPSIHATTSTLANNKFYAFLKSLFLQDFLKVCF